jgi:N-acetylneuraminic acid mutarotase
MRDRSVRKPRRSPVQIEPLEARQLMSTTWTDLDIGSPAIPGGATVNASNGAVTVHGGGADIWNQSDQFNFDYQTLTGNGTVITKVTAETNTNSWAKAGIMLRENVASDSRFVLLALAPSGKVALQARTATHTTPPVSDVINGTLNVWLKLTRAGSLFTGYSSTDDKTWTTVGSTTITMVNNIFAGLAVTAHDNTKSCTATFSNFAITATGTAASNWSAGALAPMDRWESESFSYNGKLYIFGGFIDRTLDATAECDVYNPATNAWSYLTTIPTGALTHAPVAVVGNIAYFAGGDLGRFTYGKTQTSTSEVLTYNLSTNTWGSTVSLPAAQSCGGLVYVNGSLYLYGGINLNDTADKNSTYALNLSNTKAGWVAKANMPDGRNHIGYVAINNIIYAVGGQHSYNETGGNDPQVDAYNPATNVWTAVAPLPMTWGSLHTSVLVVNGRIVVVGGQTNGGYDGIYLSTIEEYTPSTNKWTNVGALPEASEGDSVAYINNELIVADGTVDNLGGWSTNQVWLDSKISL